MYRVTNGSLQADVVVFLHGRQSAALVFGSFGIQDCTSNAASADHLEEPVLTVAVDGCKPLVRRA